MENLIGMNNANVGGLISQKGLLPAVTRWIGYFGVGYAILVAISNTYVLLQTAIQTYSGFETINQLLWDLYGIATVVFMMLLIGLLCGGLFPSLRITNKGIEYYYLFVKGLARWHEIDAVVRVKRPTKCLAIVVSRPFGIFTGLWIAQIHGQFAGVWKPVLLLAGDWENRDGLWQAIQEQKSLLNLQS